MMGNRPRHAHTLRKPIFFLDIVQTTEHDDVFWRSAMASPHRASCAPWRIPGDFLRWRKRKRGHNPIFLFLICVAQGTFRPWGQLQHCRLDYAFLSKGGVFCAAGRGQDLCCFLVKLSPFDCFSSPFFENRFLIACFPAF